MNNVKLFLTIIFILFNSVLLAENNDCNNGQLDSLFLSQISDNNLVGISSAIVKGDQIIWSKGYGVKDLQLNEKIDSSTLFHQGSISKTITLASFLHLWEEKKFNLDDDINNYLPFKVVNPNYPEVSITFRMLITHLSSINDVSASQKHRKIADLYTNVDIPDSLEFTLKEFLSVGGSLYYPDNFLSVEPGSKYVYSNVAYSLIGLLIEQISGESFINYTRKNIFNPLEMLTSTFLLSETDETNFAFQYQLDENENRQNVTPYTWAGYMDGSLRTSALEYSNFLIMLLNKGKFKNTQILSAETIEQMFQLQQLPGEFKSRMFKPVGRAMLWNLVENDDIQFYHFNGFGSSFFTETFMSTDENIAGLFFITGQYSSFPKMGQSITKIVNELINVALDL